MFTKALFQLIKKKKKVLVCAHPLFLLLGWLFPLQFKQRPVRTTNSTTTATPTTVKRTGESIPGKYISLLITLSC